MFSHTPNPTSLELPAERLVLKGCSRIYLDIFIIFNLAYYNNYILFIMFGSIYIFALLYLIYFKDILIFYVVPPIWKVLH